jgi:hypothetical protein
MEAQQEGALERAGPFGVRPAEDDEFASIETFCLDPRAAVIGQIAPVQPLRDEALRLFRSLREGAIRFSPSSSRRSKAK